MRLIMIAVLLAFVNNCFSVESASTAQNNESHQESLAVIYIGCGNGNLLYQDYSSALEDFQRASSVLDKCDCHCPELDFLIAFGRVIAYDNLGLEDKCYATMTSLLRIFNEEKNADDDFGSNGLEDESSEYYEEAGELLRKLAGLASSSVRNFLLSFVDEMSEELLPSFKVSDAVPLSQLSWKYNNRNTATVDLCKSSFWKKVGKTAKGVYKAMMKTKQVIDFLKELKETFDR